MSLFAADPEPLAALSLWNPWAQLMALGVKTCETRPPWAMRLRSLIGCDLAICSTRAMPAEAIAACAVPAIFEPLAAAHHGAARRRLTVLEVADALPCGSVLAVVTVAAVVPMVDGHEPIASHPEHYVAVTPNVLVEGRHNGAASATLRNIDYERPFGDYQPGRVAIITTNLRPLEQPVPCSGRQQVWRLPALVEAAVREQVGA